MFSQEWDIKPRGTECGQCHASFVDQQHYVSTLIFGQDGYERADYCDACWARCNVSGSEISIWKGVFKAPPPEPEEPIKKETAESLLRNLIKANDESNKNIIFVLAVMLERKRILVERDVKVREDSATIRIYEHRKTGETFVISDPMLDMDQIEQVQEEVTAMLSGRETEDRSVKREARRVKM